jgi:hypothetical protein
MSINRIYLPGKLVSNIDGNIYIRADKELMQSYFQELLSGENDADVEICITKIESKKTNKQLAYFYGMILPIIRQRFGELTGETYTKDDVMSVLKDKFFSEEIEFQGKFTKVPMSLSKAKKEELDKFIKDVMDFSKNILDVEIPEPTKEYNYGR